MFFDTANAHNVIQITGYKRSNIHKYGVNQTMLLDVHFYPALVLFEGPSWS
jgi:hypothetical protein